MRRAKQIYVTVCDGCGADCDYPATCCGCGSNFCYECRKAKCTTYEHAVNFSGTGDGLFCFSCETKLLMHPTPLFSAYQAIRRLRLEIASFYADSQRRGDLAEACLKSIRAGKPAGDAP